jgi:hypothetical protein
MPATGSIQLSDVRFQEAAGGPTVFTDKLADVAPTTAPTAEPAPEAAPFVAASAAPVAASAPATGAACSATAAIESVRVSKHRLTITGTSSPCVSAVKVTIARVSAARTSKAVRAKVKATKWTAAASLKKGKYRVSVTAAGAKNTVTKLVTVK